MSIPAQRADANSRRRFLTLVGLTATSALAGCFQGTDDDAVEASTPTAENDNHDAGSIVDCPEFDGSATAFDPGDDPWVFLFDYPDTWEPWESEFDEDFEGAVSADIGHTATAIDHEHRVNIRIDHVTVSRDYGLIDDWFESGNFVADKTLEYDGETLEVATGHVTPGDVVWRVALPSPNGVSEGYYQVSWRAWMVEEYFDCSDAIFDVAWQAFSSIRPNPEYAG